MQSFIIEHSLLLLLLLLLLLVFTLWCSKNTFTGGEESECDRHPFSGRNALPHVGIHSCYGWSDLGAERFKLDHFHTKKIVYAAAVVVVFGKLCQ